MKRRRRALPSRNARQQLEEAGTLIESEFQYRQIVENSPNVIFLVDREDQIHTPNQSCCTLLGYGEETAGRNLREIVIEEDSDRAQSLVRDVFECRQTVNDVPITYRCRDGAKRKMLSRLYPLVDQRGRVQYCVVANTDMTERVMAEEKMRQSFNLLQAVAEGTTDVIYVKDALGRYLMVNSAGASLFAQSVEKILGKYDAQLFPAEVASRLMSSDREVMETEQTRTYEETFTLGGAVRTYLSKKGPYYDQNGHVIGLIGISHDITERKNLEEQLRQAQKMEAVGLLAAGVAHDFNNTLTAVLGYAGLLLEELGEDHPLSADVEEIRKSAEHAVLLTRQLLAFSRREATETRVLNLNELISGMKELIRRLIGENIEGVLLLNPGAYFVKADPGQIEQILMNLVVNARDAMPEGGTLTIQTTDVKLDDSCSSRYPGLVPGSYVVITVRDTGIGMEKEVQSRIFEPFFTTKARGTGTGLGLATTYGIVRRYEGHIEVESERGRGSTFTIFLPICSQAETLDTEIEMTGTELKGSETILVVEDEKPVRKLIARVLRRAGYKVLEASDGGSALLLVRGHKEELHLVISDVVMPVLGGPELVAEVWNLHPHLKILFISGYPAFARTLKNVEKTHTSLLKKPFTADALLRTVRALLDSPSIVPG